MAYNPSAYFVASFFPLYFQTAAKTEPIVQKITRTRSGRGFKSLSETFTVVHVPDNYDQEDEELLFMLAMLA